MENPNKIFDRFCIREGLAKEVMTADDLSQVAPLLQHDRLVTKVVSGKHKLPTDCKGVFVGVVKSNSFNAFAAQDSGWFLIGVNQAVYTVMRNIFCRMLADRRVFPNIGDPSLEEENLPLLDLKDSDKVLHDTSNVYPKCAKRSLYSYMLYEECMEFLISHELAHIIRGHVGFMTKGQEGIVYSELSPIVNLSDNSLESQAMEAHADLSAAKRCLLSTLKKCRLSTEKELGKDRHEFYSKPMLCLTRNSLAIYTLFKVFMPNTIDLTRLDEGSHPHPLIRQAFLMGVLNETLIDSHSKLAKDSGAIGYTAIRVAENAISLANGGDEVTETPKELRYNRASIRDHMKRLLRTIDLIRPQLSNYAWPSTEE